MGGLLILMMLLFLSTGSSLGDDSLRLKICKGYAGFIVEKMKATYSGCLNIQEVCASIPSLFHLEVLLMAFHSSNAFEKIKMAEKRFAEKRFAENHVPLQLATIVNFMSFVTNLVCEFYVFCDS